MSYDYLENTAFKKYIPFFKDLKINYPQIYQEYIQLKPFLRMRLLQATKTLESDLKKFLDEIPELIKDGIPFPYNTLQIDFTANAIYGYLRKNTVVCGYTEEYINLKDKKEDGVKEHPAMIEKLVQKLFLEVAQLGKDGLYDFKSLFFILRRSMNVIWATKKQNTDLSQYKTETGLDTFHGYSEDHLDIKIFTNDYKDKPHFETEELLFEDFPGVQKYLLSEKYPELQESTYRSLKKDKMKPLPEKILKRIRKELK